MIGVHRKRGHGQSECRQSVPDPDSAAMVTNPVVRQRSAVIVTNNAPTNCGGDHQRTGGQLGRTLTVQWMTSQRVWIEFPSNLKLYLLDLCWHHFSNYFLSRASRILQGLCAPKVAYLLLLKNCLLFYFKVFNYGY